MSTNKASTATGQPESSAQQTSHEPAHAVSSTKRVDHPKGPKKKKRGPAFWAVVGVVAVAAAVWLAEFVQRAIVYEETDDAYVAGHMHMISSRLDASVTEVLVEENQAVKAGQVLARLDPLGLQIAVEKSNAALHAAQADAQRSLTAVEQAKAESMQAQAQVSVAEAQVLQSSAELDLAKVNSGRSEKLFNTDTRTISESEVDSNRSVAAASSARLAAMRASLAAAQAKVRVDDAAITAAQAEVASAEAKVEADRESVRDAQRELSYATITAPIDGRIGNKNVEVGNRVQVGQPLFALVDPTYWVTANFKETQLRKMSVGQPVELTIDAIGSHRFMGKVVSFAPATGAEFALLPADNATGNFTKVVQRVPVKIAFDPDSVAGFEDRLRPGLSVVVSVKIK